MPDGAEPRGLKGSLQNTLLRAGCAGRRETGPRVWGGMSPGTGIPGVKVTTLSTILWGQGPAFSYCLRGIDEQHIHLQAGRAEAEKLSLPDYRVTTSVSKRQQPERVGRQT